MDTRAANPDRPSANSFVLTHLDVYDWGAFAGRHCAEIDSRGTAIIGPTGSGKTTLVDALMTLITTNPRYNLASTGGIESDRDLVSYVRGVSGAGNDSGDNEHVARPGAVVTGIAARFSNGQTSVRIGAVLWFDGSSSAVADLKRRWVFSLADSPSLDDWLEAHRAGGTRALKQLESDASGLKFYEAKQAYLARLRNFFEVGENAFNLLNRAAGLKQLNSIDEVFRELVLDDHSAFGLAADVAREFDTLTGIRTELELARQQRDSLLPVEQGWTLRSASVDELALQRRLHGLLPIWFATHAFLLWEDRAKTLQGRIDNHQSTAQVLGSRIDATSSQAQALQGIYLQTGGALIEELRKGVERQGEVVGERKQHASDYRKLAALLQLDDTLVAECFEANRVQVRQRKTELIALGEEQAQQSFKLGVVQQRDQETLDRIAAELVAVQKTPGSNIPPECGRFRAELCAHLGLRVSAVPFVAELVAVKANEARWRGAIERAIGVHRLRLLIAPTEAKRALYWINQRDNHLHVRLREAETPVTPVRFFEDGFSRKIEFKAHAHREVLKQLLGRV